MSPRASDASFEEIFRATFDQVVRFVARRVPDAAEVADVVSATYLEALIHWKRYDRRKGEPVVWLLGIARNLCARDARRRALEAQTVRESSGRQLLDADEYEELEALIDAVRLAPAVALALRGLSDRDQELFRMIHEDELEIGQAAEVLGMTAVAARMRLMRMRREVRAMTCADAGVTLATGEPRS
jgi:RNA polymerase sigma factor (sigma-70 family)